MARVVLPPLRERREDVPALIDHFVAELAGMVPDEPIFTPSELEALAQQHWSGNIRELRNLVESKLALGDLALPPGQDERPSRATSIERYRDARSRVVSSFERSYLTNLMQVCEGNASEAARRAKMDRPYLLTLLKRHSLR